MARLDLWGPRARTKQCEQELSGATATPDYKLAIARYQEFLREHPKDPGNDRVLYQLARAQLLRNRRAEAIVSFRKLRQLDPSRQLGRLELLALESGRDPAASAAMMTRELRELAQAQPDQAQLRAQLAAVLFSQGKTDGAEAEFRSALKLDSRYAPAALGLAQIALHRGKFDEALELVRFPLRTNPNDLQANLIAARAEMARGRMDDAARYYEVVLSVNPKIAPANLALAQLRLARGNPQDATKYARAALQEDPKLPGAWLVLGNVAVSERRYDEAIEQCRQVLSQE